MDIEDIDPPEYRDMYDVADQAAQAASRWQARALAAEAEVARLTATVPLPVVAHKGEHSTDADMFRAAASRLERNYPVGGSNLRDALVRLIRREIERAEATR